ncbi:Influenza virus NS1A-binding protein-like protein A [Trichoplax sp. H2]|nr:Influenza virus NS1A-binding protein-like protein A [Trichoplax sp. H2]|eukprot:RDD45019.1 Influenza virus NS1A-binding protein-like protein A [Trichoplax sp. H2]
MDRDQTVSIISSHRIRLINCLKKNILPGITQLYNKKFFTVKDCQQVKGESTPAAQASKILDLAVSKSNKKLSIFIEALLTVCPELQELFATNQSDHDGNIHDPEDSQSILPWQGNTDNDSKTTSQQVSPREIEDQIKVMNVRGDNNQQADNSKSNINSEIELEKNHHIFIAGGINDGYLCNHVEVFDSTTISWTTLYPMEAGCYGASGGILTNKFIVCGGFVETDGLSNRTRYCNLKTMKWDTLECMKEPKKYSCSCVWNNRLIIVGGLKGTEALKKVEVYFYNSGVWSRTSLPAMISRRYGSACVTTKNHLVVVGGQGEHDGLPLSSVESYQLSHKAWEKPQWKILNKMCQPRTFPAAATWHDYIIVAGGFDGVQKLDTVEWYDIRTNKWKLLTKMPSRRDNCQAKVIGNYYIIIGGNDGKHNLTNVDAFDLVEKKWHHLPGLRFGRSSYACGDLHLQI